MWKQRTQEELKETTERCILAGPASSAPSAAYAISGRPANQLEAIPHLRRFLASLAATPAAHL
jgi:hypothetical protein